MYKYIIILFLMVQGLSCRSQVTVKEVSKKALKLYNQSSNLMAEGKEEAAEKALLKSLEAEPEFVDAMLRLGDLYFLRKEYKKSAGYMTQAIALDSFYATKPYYIGGIAYYNLEEFGKAAELLKLFNKIAKASPRKLAQVATLIRNCEFAEEAVKNPVDFKATNMGSQINSAKHEYLPTLTADESMLYFTRRKGHLEDIFQSKMQDGSWEKASPLSGVINTPQFGEGSQAISPDGKTLYFAADYGGNGKRGWDIYQSEWQKDGWSKPILMDYPLNTVYYESQPSISFDGKSLYFCSKRPGGLGGKDIWVSHMKDDCTWGEPENLGPAINTLGDEEVPFIHPDNQTLYFGSDGHAGMGGSDLYISRIQPDGQWGIPVNLGYPLNTTDNEGSVFVATNGQKAYFASDYLGGEGGFDLYEFELWNEIKPQPVSWVKAIIFDDETKERVTSDFELYELESGKLIISSKCHDYLKTDFLIVLPAGKTYALNIDKPGYLFHSEHFNLSESIYFEPEEYDIYLKKLKKGNVLTLNNILFKTKSYDLLENSKIELDKVVQLLKNNPEMHIQISGHTDDVGTGESNLVLSENRAKSVYEYFIEKGIDKKRLSFKGFGESKPVAGNETPKGRALNRRTEIEILEIYQKMAPPD
jgi:outer membrane protein OmpA-like peptidoglycan-associated protein/tetratricopeptide (TPR) repeat protein